MLKQATKMIIYFIKENTKKYLKRISRIDLYFTSSPVYFMKKKLDIIELHGLNLLFYQGKFE